MSRLTKKCWAGNKREMSIRVPVKHKFDAPLRSCGEGLSGEDELEDRGHERGSGRRRPF